MDCDEALGTAQVSLLIARLTEDLTSSALLEAKSINKRKTRENSISGEINPPNADDATMRTLILHLHTGYPGDLGSLCPLLLNCLYLTEGEAFFMGSNEPHAYISGESEGGLRRLSEMLP
jgi:mannose-6-phosphate isomerase class I